VKIIDENPQCLDSMSVCVRYTGVFGGAVEIGAVIDRWQVTATELIALQQRWARRLQLNSRPISQLLLLTTTTMHNAISTRRTCTSDMIQATTTLHVDHRTRPTAA